MHIVINNGKLILSLWNFNTAFRFFISIQKVFNSQNLWVLGVWVQEFWLSYFLGPDKVYQSAFQSEDAFESYRVYRQRQRRRQRNVDNP